MLLRKLYLMLLVVSIFFDTEVCLADLLERHSWEIGPEVTHIEYEEPHIMKEKGTMYGVVGSYIFHDKAMFQADSRISYGQVDYSSPESGTMDNIDDMIFELRGGGGYGFELSDSTVLTPFAGLGYRYLVDDSSDRRTSVGDYGYKRESNYFYSPLGFKISTRGNGWSFGASVEYDHFWFGRQVSYLSDVDDRYEDVKNRQETGYGYRGYIEVRKDLERVSFSVRPTFRYWNIDESEHEDYRCGPFICEGWEPRNHSTEAGVSFLVKF